MSEPTSLAQNNPTPAGKPLDKSRLGVVLSVYHQQTDVQPVVVTARFSRWLTSSEQPYIRRLTLTTAWQALDSGWLEGKVGMLVIRNEEGAFAVQPTPEERQEMAMRIIEVGLLLPSATVQLAPLRTMRDPPLPPLQPLPCWIIQPKESLQAQPANAALLHLRCQSGSARCTLYLLPE